VGLDPVWSGEGSGAESVLASAAERGIAHALLPRLRKRGGEVEVQLLLYVPASRELLADERSPRRADPVRKRFVERCLAERGYEVAGWR
jgi:hypothetical protein